MKDSHHPEGVTAIILAAGTGTRLLPHTIDKPKCLIEIQGQSLLARQIQVLRSRDINRIIVVGGHQAAQLDGRDFELRVNERYKETNMVSTLFTVEDRLEGSILISYGDIIYSGTILDKLLSSSNMIDVVVDKDWENYWRARFSNPLDDAETLKLDAEDRILEIGGTPSSLDEIEGQYIGLMKFSAKGVELLKTTFWNCQKSNNICGKSIQSAYMTDLLQQLIFNGVSVSAVSVSGGWIEVDHPGDLSPEIIEPRLRQDELGFFGQ